MSQAPYAPFLFNGNFCCDLKNANITAEKAEFPGSNPEARIWIKLQTDIVGTHLSFTLDLFGSLEDWESVLAQARSVMEARK